MKIKFLWAIMLIGLLNLLSANVGFSGKHVRMALLIGNSDYTHGGSLANPVNDVRDMKKALESVGFTVYKYENCTQKTMKRAMDEFGKKLKGKDVGLFFYAGHGVQVKGHNYLIPIDAKLENENDAEYDSVRADRLLAKMEAAGTKTNILILDACRDNPFERSWSRGTEGTGLAFMSAPSGSLIAYSTAPGKTAFDGHRGKNSPYTSALLQHIDTPDITALQMFQQVRHTVMKGSGNQQIPWESTSLKGDFFFNDRTGIPVKHYTEDLSPGEKSHNVDKTALPEQIGKLSEALESKPDDKNIYISRGNAYLELKEYSKAIRDFSRSIELNPDNWSGYFFRGMAYSELKEYSKAIQDYTETLKLKPDDKSIYILRGNDYLKLKEYSKAIQDYSKVSVLNPDDETAYALRAIVYTNIGEYSNAVKDYSKAVALNPGNAGFYFFRGDVYESLKQYSRAIEDYDKAIELDPTIEGIYFIRGNAHFKLKQYVKAIQNYDKAIELNSKHPESYANRGRAYWLLGKINQACFDLKKACSLGDCTGLEMALEIGYCQ